MIITEKLAERQGLKAGDIITVEDADGTPQVLPSPTFAKTIFPITFI